MAISGFEKGKWYTCSLPKGIETPSGWNERMNSVLGGVPCLCIFANNEIGSSYAEFKDHSHYDECSDAEIMAGKKIRGWDWGHNLSDWNEVPSAMIDAESLLHSGLMATMITPYYTTAGVIKDADEKFVFPHRASLRSELLAKLSHY